MSGECTCGWMLLGKKDRVFVGCCKVRMLGSWLGGRSECIKGVLREIFG